jgi:hypothetical protein
VSVFERLNRFTDWRFWAILFLSLTLLYYLAGLTLYSASYPYHYLGNLLYPWFIIYNHWLFGFIIFTLAAISLIKLFRSLSLHPKRRDLFLVTIALAIAVWLCASATLGRSFAPSVTHITSSEFNGNVYQLALSYGSSSDLDTLLAVYIVYQCDSLGLICHRYYCPYYESLWGEPPPNVSGFSVDASRKTLSIQIGEKKSEVINKCQYGGAYAK